MQTEKILDRPYWNKTATTVGFTRWTYKPGGISVGDITLSPHQPEPILATRIEGKRFEDPDEAIIWVEEADPIDRPYTKGHQLPQPCDNDLSKITVDRPGWSEDTSDPTDELYNTWHYDSRDGSRVGELSFNTPDTKGGKITVTRRSEKPFEGEDMEAALEWVEEQPRPWKQG